MQSRIIKLGPPTLVVAVYLVAIVFTNAHFMADSVGYVISILGYGLDGNPVMADFRTENGFWDFGHLLWRPLGLLLFKVFTPLSSLVIGKSAFFNLLFQLMVVNFVAGLLSALLFYFVLDKVTGRRWLAVFVSILFIFSHGFLNFTQTSSSYIAGLTFLLAALYLLVKDKDNLSRGTAIGAGLVCAVAVTLWVPYLLVIPGTIVAPFFLFDLDRRQKLSMLWAAGAFLIATGSVYLIVMAAIGVHTPTDLRDWISTSSHGVQTSGLLRAVFGLPRSFIHMGNDGILFKRFLLKDPFNPVTIFDLVRLSLWKLMLFYLALAALSLTLLISSRRRILLLLLLTAGPLILLAIKFDGGAIERYLPIYPVLFLALAYSLTAPRAPRVLQAVLVLFFVAAMVANTTAMAGFVLDRQNQQTAERVQEIMLQWKPHSWLVTTHLQDDLVNFQASFPFHPVNRQNRYRVYSLVLLNNQQTVHWREEFATTVRDTWDKGGDAWLSKRLFSPKPESVWNWVEGDDPRVTWKHINQFFSQFETGILAGGEDGFVLLEKSETNKQLLNAMLENRTTN